MYFSSGDSKPRTKGDLVVHDGSGMRRLAVGATDGMVLKADSSATAGVSYTLGLPSIVKITADQTSTSTTVANVTGLAFSVLSGRYYRFSFEMIHRTTDLTKGLRATITTPTFTSFAAVCRSMAGASGGGGEHQYPISASGEEVAFANATGADTDYIARIEGSILPSANGTIQVQFGLEATAATVTIRKGSNGLLWDLGT